MRSVVFLFTFVLLNSGCFTLSKKRDAHRLIAGDTECQLNWQYFNLEHKISGTIIEYHRATVFCGTVATASSTVIVTSDRDTVRIIGLCNMSNEFSKSDSVEITPADKPPFNVMIMADELYCRVKRSCYGQAAKIK